MRKEFVINTTGLWRALNSARYVQLPTLIFAHDIAFIFVGLYKKGRFKYVIKYVLNMLCNVTCLTRIWIIYSSLKISEQLVPDDDDLI